MAGEESVNQTVSTSDAPWSPAAASYTYPTLSNASSVYRVPVTSYERDRNGNPRPYTELDENGTCVLVFCYLAPSNTSINQINRSICMADIV